MDIRGNTFTGRVSRPSPSRPGQRSSPRPWRAVEVVLGDMVQWRPGGAGGMAGLDDLKGRFQQKRFWFCDLGKSRAGFRLFGVPL